MNLAKLVFTYYSFNEFFSLLLDNVGLEFLLLFLGGLVGLSAYLVSMPTLGLFSGNRSPISFSPFLQQVIYIFSGIQFISLVYDINNIYDIFRFLLFYIPLIITSIYYASSFSRHFKFEEYCIYQKNPSFFYKEIVDQRLVFLTLQWFVIYSISMYVIFLNLNFMLISWFLLLYALITSLLQLAVGHGILKQLKSSPYCKIITTKGEDVTGFLTSKGNDHYIVHIREKGELVLSNNIIEEIHKETLPTCPKLYLEDLNHEIEEVT